MTQQPDIRYNFLNGRIVKYWTPLNPNDYVIDTQNVDMMIFIWVDVINTAPFTI